VSEYKPGQFGEPWHQDSSGGGIRSAKGSCRSPHHNGCMAASVIYFDEHPEGEQEARASRIVACVNALDGRDPEALKGLIEAATFMREMCEAIVALSSGWDEDGSLGPSNGLSWESVGRMALDLARAAVTKAEESDK
jgi:hypothetical protein